MVKICNFQGGYIIISSWVINCSYTDKNINDKYLKYFTYYFISIQ